MNTFARPAVVGATKLVAEAKKYLWRVVEAVVEAKARRIQHEIEFHRSFNAYRKGKDIPPLNEDLRSGS